MKRISLQKKVHRRAWLVCFLIGLLSGLFSGAQAWGWSEAARNAAEEVAGGNPSPESERISFENNEAINRMGARGTDNGGINNQAYQANQKAFTAKNNEHIRNAANDCGLDVEIKEPSGDPKAGADTDVNVKTKNGKPLTYEQWKQLNEAYNRRVNEYLKKPPGSKVNTATDLMPDAKTTSPEEFQKINQEISKQGGTTYKDPAAVKVENAMAKGEPIVLNEVGSYVKELQGQAKTHFDAAAKTTAEANAKARALGESHPDVQDLRAKAQIENSQGAKYIEKIENVGSKIRSDAGIAAAPGTEAPSAKLTEALKNNRGADTIAQSEQIGPVSENALNNATKSTIEDLARIGHSNPQAAPACQQAIADSLRDLPMSQKGQAMDLIKTKYGSDFAKGVAKAAQGPTGGATVMKGFEKVMKVLGPGLLVYDGVHRIVKAWNAPDDAKTYVAGTAAGGFIGGLGGALGVGTVVGIGVGAVLGAPVTVGVAAVTIGAGLVGGMLGYGVGDYAGTSLAGWVLEGVRPKDQSEYDALAAKGLLDGSKDIYGQLIAAGADPATAAAAAAAYKNGDVKTFREILAGIRDKLVKNAKKMPTRRFTDMPKTEVQQLLDCLCSQSLGANPWVAQGYNTTIPPDADPKKHSCGSLNNGPCMAQGFGCWRSYIKWGNPGISDCLASFNLPTNSWRTIAEIDGAYQKPYEKPFKVSVKVEPTEFCPGDAVTVTMTPEGGRGACEFRYDAGWPLQRPKNGPKNAWTKTGSGSMTFTADPTIKRGFFDGQWVYTRPMEAYPTYIQVWATGSTFDPSTGNDVPVEFSQILSVRLRSDPECAKLHPLPPPETKKPPVKKPPAKPVKDGMDPYKEDQINNPDGTQTPPPDGSTEVGVKSTPGTKTTGTKPPSKGNHKPPKGATTSKTPFDGPEGTSGEPTGEGTSTGTPESEGGGGGGDSVPEDECWFGGGGTAIDNGPVNMWMEVPEGQRIRVTIKGSDGFTKTIEGVGRVDISRPRNPSGADTILMENLDRPKCVEQQVAEYDTNGIPVGPPPSATTGLEGSEPGLGDFPANGTILTDSADALGGFVGTTSAKNDEKTDKGFKTIQITTESQAKETSSDLDISAADHIKDAGGADAQDTKDATAKGTAKIDQDNSWGKTLGDSIQKGFEDGASAAASAFGAAAADQAAGTVFGGTKSGSGEDEESSSGAGEQVSGGSTSGGGGGGGSGGGYTRKGTGQGSVPPPVQTNPPPVSAGSTITCPSCGATFNLGPGESPPKWCPTCCAGPDSTECAHCGYRWCGQKGPPPSTCPKCGWHDAPEEAAVEVSVAPVVPAVPPPAPISQ